ncbi:MAG: hypothetical protein J6D16_00600, partial [Clostridia bacterium]|nr:hypothetical protein [Clostridia bacterium]
MLNYEVKIGLVAMRRNATDRPRGTFLTWYSAEQRGERFVKYIEEHFATDKVSFVDNKGIGIRDLVFDDKSAAEVIERFKAEKVDAVMIINCNFGNEEAAADIAKALGKPVLLWAPLDDEYYVDGMRPTDSQCGLFGVSRQFQRYHIPFSHLPCCRVESDEFKEGFERFVRVACMVKNFTGLRIGQIGSRPTPFFSVIWNEGDLMEQFGIRIVALNFAMVEQRMKAAPELYADEIAEYEKYFTYNYKSDELTPGDIKPMATLAAVYKHLFDEFDLDVISAECWTATPLMFDGLAPCAVYGLLNDLGYMVSCES